MRHGASAYKTGRCRCDECRIAAREQTRAWKERNIALGIPPPRHGLNGYINYGCRCGECRAGQAAYLRDYRNRARDAS